MVAIEHEPDKGECCFVLRPDYVPRWQQTVAVFALCATACLGIALLLTLGGFWPVLPFAGAEVALLGWALYLSARRGTEREVIRIRAATVEVEKGHRRPACSWSFQRSWTEVRLRPSGHHWYPSRLCLRSQGRELEIGVFLPEEERVRVARELERLIGPMASPRGRGSAATATALPPPPGRPPPTARPPALASRSLCYSASCLLLPV